MFKFTNLFVKLSNIKQKRYSLKQLYYLPIYKMGLDINLFRKEKGIINLIIKYFYKK
jgi:hypothetical protein